MLPTSTVESPKTKIAGTEKLVAVDGASTAAVNAAATKRSPGFVAIFLTSDLLLRTGVKVFMVSANRMVTYLPWQDTRTVSGLDARHVDA